MMNIVQDEYGADCEGLPSVLFIRRDCPENSVAESLKDLYIRVKNGDCSLSFQKYNYGR